ncbi:MAG: DUF167 domain-containing protein [Acidobacteria bacterium]|nr:DUF167 domain-containing protein [Acidobacteriota bacterium]
MRSESDSVTISVRVQPRAARDSIKIQPDGIWKVRLTTAPVKGAANAALIVLLAKTLGVPRSCLQIVTGKSGRDKLVRVSGMHRASLAAKLSGDDRRLAADQRSYERRSAGR